MTPTPRTTSSLLAAGALTATVLLGGSAVAGGGTIGAAGIGDSYYPRYGNGGYDVDHYDLAITYRPATQRLVGDSVVTATATQDLTRFDLDLLLDVSSVRVDGAPADFSQRGQELRVTPAARIDDGDTFSVRVRYSGKPGAIDGPGSIDPWVSTADGAVAVGEPEIAAWWYPSNDHPRDVATFDIDLTVPRGTQAISNGTLGGRSTSGDDVTWRWRPRDPMATYLAFMAVGRFDVVQGTSQGRPFVDAYSRNLSAQTRRAAERSVGQTPAITRFEEQFFGPYPFETVGGVVPGGKFGFALENQTRPVHSKGFFQGGANTFVIAHEQAHQWFGDNVTVRRWRDIWLNEGFASYAEYLWAQERFGVLPQRTFEQSYDSYDRRSGFWDLRIGNPGAHNEFAGPVYERGAMTLQALRNRLGRDDFFTLLRDWGQDPGSRTIGAFRARAEALAGHPMQRFFDVWLFTGAKPAATVVNGVVPPGGRLAGSDDDARRVVQAIRATHRLLDVAGH